MVYVQPRISSYAPSTLTKYVQKGVKSVKTAHLNLMPASDEGVEHTIGRAAAHRPTLDHNIIYVAGENLKLRPFYAHAMTGKVCKKCQNSPSQLEREPLGHLGMSRGDGRCA
jgi:hypothetical protein